VYTVFAPYSPPIPYPHILPLPQTGSVFPPVLRFCKRKKNDSFVCLR
jgi:hypothetical protein